MCWSFRAFQGETAEPTQVKLPCCSHNTHAYTPTTSGTFLPAAEWLHSSRDHLHPQKVHWDSSPTPRSLPLPFLLLNLGFKNPSQVCLISSNLLLIQLVTFCRMMVSMLSKCRWRDGETITHHQRNAAQRIIKSPTHTTRLQKYLGLLYIMSLGRVTEPVSLPPYSYDTALINAVQRKVDIKGRF